MNGDALAEQLSEGNSRRDGLTEDERMKFRAFVAGLCCVFIGALASVAGAGLHWGWSAAFMVAGCFAVLIGVLLVALSVKD